jgi:hypothetical protein
LALLAISRSTVARTADSLRLLKRPPHVFGPGRHRVDPFHDEEGAARVRTVAAWHLRVTHGTAVGPTRTTAARVFDEET